MWAWKGAETKSRGESRSGISWRRKGRKSDFRRRGFKTRTRFLFLFVYFFIFYFFNSITKTVNFKLTHFWWERQCYHSHHIHKVQDVSSDSRFANVRNKVLFIQELATYRKDVSFTWGRAARAAPLCSLSAEWEALWLLFPSWWDVMAWCRWPRAAKPGVTSALALLVVTLPPRHTHVSADVGLTTFSASCLAFVFYFDSFDLHGWNKKCFM